MRHPTLLSVRGGSQTTRVPTPQWVVTSRPCVAYAEMQDATVAEAVELREVIEQHAVVVDRRQDARDEEPITVQFFPEVGADLLGMSDEVCVTSDWFHR